MPADIPLQLKDWYSDPALNVPAGGTLVSNNLDDNLRTILAVVRMLASSNSLAVGATTNLGTRDETILTLTGAGATISSFGTLSAGMFKVIVFDGINTLAHNATAMKLPGGANITTAADDSALMLSLGSGNWRCLFYSKANGNPVSINTLLADGAVAAPALAFASETGLGIYRLSAGVLGVAQGGTLRFSADANGIQVAMSGTTSAITLGTGGGYLSNGINVVGNIGTGSGVAVYSGFGPNAGHYYSAGTAPSFNSHYRAIDTSAGNGNAYAFYAENTNGPCFKVTTTGSVASDGGTTMTTPADYAEMFEWADGNPTGEDRVGYSVALVGDKIRVAGPEDTPIGIVSGNPAVLGDAGDLRWVDQYLRDAFNRPVLEDAELIEWADEAGTLHTYYADTLPADVTPPEDARRETVQRRKVNPAFDSSADYTPRRDRKEWAAVGLMGKLRLRNDQCVSTRWVHMRDITDDVSEWLVI